MTLQNVKISLKTDDLSNWTSFNPVLNDGELAIVNDISANLIKFKVGNGLSTFTQLPYVDDKIVTNYLQANDVQAHHFSQGVHAESSPLGLAAGYFLSAAANFSQVMGVNAQAAAGTDYSFVWNGNDIEALGQYYSAHGKGSFNINPLSGISGVYVGEQTLADIIDSNVSSKQDALDDAQMSAVNSGITSGKVQKYDGYEAAIQQKIELSDIPSDLSAFTNSPGYLVSNDISDYYKKSETSSAAEISDAFALSSGNKVFIDDHILSSAGYSDLSVVKLSASEYEALVSTSATISNALYIVEDEFEDAYGQQVKNMAPGTDLSDAVNVEQLSNAINNIQIPTDLSAFTNSPGYLVSNDISDYYKKSETSSASEISTALANAGGGSGQLSTKLDSSASWPAWVGGGSYDYKQIVSHNGKLWQANAPYPEGEPGSSQALKWLSVDINSILTSQYQSKGNYLTAVPTTYKTYSQTVAALSNDGYATSAQVNQKSTVSFNQITTTGTNIGSITIDGTTTQIYAPTNGGGGGSSVQVSADYQTGTRVATISVDNVPTSIYVPNGGGGGSNVQVSANYQSGINIATISVDSVPTSIYVPNSGGGSSRYALVTAQLVSSGGSLTCAVDDQTITTIQVSSSATPIVVQLPAQPEDGARDFILRIEISSSAAPTFTFNGVNETIDFDSEDADWAVMEPGLNLVSFTETKRGGAI